MQGLIRPCFSISADWGSYLPLTQYLVDRDSTLWVLKNERDLFGDCEVIAEAKHKRGATPDNRVNAPILRNLRRLIFWVKVLLSGLYEPLGTVLSKATIFNVSNEPKDQESPPNMKNPGSI